MDALAAKIGVDPAELRRRNMIKESQFPYTAMTGLQYDSGNHEGALAKALELCDYDGRRAEQARRRAAGSTKHLGVGISSYFEMCGLAPSRVLASLNYSAGGWEAATVRVLPTNKVQVVTGASPHGQGHETSWSMIIADKLGVDPDDVDVLHSDTAISPLGLDTYGSRSLAVGGIAIAMAADKVIVKARKIAAHLLECAEEDLEFSAGTFSVKGSPDKAMPLAGVAFEAFTAHNLPDGVEPNLEESVVYDPPNFSWPFGTHICVVEIDEETGKVDVRAVRRGRRLRRADQPDDRRRPGPRRRHPRPRPGPLGRGRLRRRRQPSHVDAGRLPGARGLRRAVVRPSGTPSRPSPTNQLGVKGIGEAGTIGAAPAVINAVVDALSHLGVTDMLMPASPMRVWSTIQAAKSASSQMSGGAK